MTSARWDDTADRWDVTTEGDFVARARWLITAMGALSVPTLPDIDGRDDFEGASFHTARWPHESFDVTGMRVGVVGTGATGVQVIQEVAKTAAHLTVFQRSPNWCAPLNNSPIDDAKQRNIKETQKDLLRRCNETYGGFLHDSEPLATTDVSPEEREAFWERRYAEPGFGIWFGNYRDVLVDRAANRLLSEFMAGKIAERVNDPAVADKLTPKDHGFGTRRVPLETGYYDVYNQENVDLVDLNETPIERITLTGIRTTAAEHLLDLIVYATGFDAVTGAFDKIDFRGVDGRSLREAWVDGPVTMLGLQTPGFPNLFTIVGPHNVSTFCNMPRCIEQNVDWITTCIAHLSTVGATRIEARDDAAAEWTEHVHETVDRLLMSSVDSWFNGANANLPDRKRTPLVYSGGLGLYRERCDDIAASGYPGFDIR